MGRLWGECSGLPGKQLLRQRSARDSPAQPGQGTGLRVAQGTQFEWAGHRLAVVWRSCISKII